MPASYRKSALFAHVVFTSAWIGSVFAFLLLALVGLYGNHPQVYPAMELMTTWIIVPVAFLSLGTGILLSLVTSWGLTPLLGYSKAPDQRPVPPPFAGAHPDDPNGRRAGRFVFHGFATRAHPHRRCRGRGVGGFIAGHFFVGVQAQGRAFCFIFLTWEGEACPPTKVVDRMEKVSDQQYKK